MDAVINRFKERTNWYLEFAALRNVVGWLEYKNPEMTEDDILFANMVEGSTDLVDLEQKALRQYYYRDKLIKELERQNDEWRKRIQTCRSIGHITEKQQFPEGTIYETAAPRPLLYDEATIPDKYWKIDQTKVREALQKGESVGDARLLTSNDPPRLTIRTK